MSDETSKPKKSGRPKGSTAKKRKPAPVILSESGVPLSKRQINALELENKKLEAKKAYKERKEREAKEAALTPIEKEALKLLREEERLKQAAIKANEQAQKETIRNEKVSMEMARIKAEETRLKIEEKPLSLSQLTKLFFKTCDTRADLKAWIKYFLGLDLPDYTTSRYADSNPLDIIWEIYRICVHKKNPENVEELLVVAGRGSGKTLSVAIAEFLLLFHDQRDVAHVGAILSQAKRCYEYQVGFLLSDKVKQILNQEINTKPMIEKMTQEKSLFNVKDRFTGETVRVGLEVLPCTLKAVNGAHVAFVSVDEIDTISGEGARALLDVSGMLDSKRGRKALRVGISTRKSRYGIMNRQIEEAEKAGRTVRKWTILEFSERCDDARSGRIPTDAYINQDTLEVLLPKDFEKLDKRKKGEFELNHFPGDRCIVCPLAALCRGDAKLQKSSSTMLKPISDAIKKTRENGPDWAISQLFNLKPSVEGVIFKEFDEKVHVQEWNGMWEILTGTSYPGVCTHDIFVKKCHSMNLPSYAGLDFGWSSPAAYVVLFVDNRENVYVTRTEARTYTNNPTWIQTAKQRWHPIYKSQLYFPDCANPGDVQMCRQEGLPVPTNQIKDIPGGIQVIKKWLRSLASPTPKFYVAKETNTFLIEEFKLYHFKTDAAGVITDDPEDENNHAIDALRYIMYGLFSKSRSVMSSSDSEFDIENVLTENGSLKRAPSAVEFAAIHNIPINTEVFDPKSIGKMVRASEMTKEAEENDEGVGGSGAFLFSF